MPTRHSNFRAPAFISLISFALLCAFPHAHAATYILTPLGDLDAVSGYQPIQINDAGQVVGHAFFWETNGATSDLNTLIGDVGTAAGINNAGQVAVQLARPGFIQGSVWDSNNGFNDVLVPDGAVFSVPTSLNNAGQVAGFSESIEGRSAFFYDGNETVIDVGSLPSHSVSSATDVNDGGQVIGVSGTGADAAAFTWDSTNGMSALELGSQPLPNAINNHGQVVGKNSSGAFVWDSTNGMTDLSAEFGQTGNAREINDLGQVVGESSSGAFIWDAENGGVNLNTRLTPTADGWHLNAAIGINSSGQIVGWGFAPNDLSRGFFLTPVQGDFSDDGKHDADDIDALVAAIDAGDNDPTYDLTGDGIVDAADRDAWLAEAGEAIIGAGKSFPVGDLNFSGSADSTDLGRLLNNFGEPGASYSGGDLNGDSKVDSADLGQLLNSFGPSVATVPEPATLQLLGFCLLALALGLRRGQANRLK